MNEDVTEWTPECACGWHVELPMLADDPTGEYALEVTMAHLIECGDDDA